MIILRYKRRPNIIQTQLDDYIGPIKKHIFNMSDPRDYRIGKKFISLQKKGRKRGRPRTRLQGRESHIPDYIVSNGLEVMKPRYLLRFPRHLPMPTELGRIYLSAEDAALYWEVDGFEGFFDDLFLINDLSYWNRVEDELESLDLMRSIPNLHDMFIYECLRIQLGIEQYAQFIRVLSFMNIIVLHPILEETAFIPTDQDFSDFYHVTPLEAFESIYQHLVEECFRLKFISCRVLIWDCQFLHSNSSDYKSKDNMFYSDKDAGLGVHDNKFLGVGYMVSTLYAYCGDVIVPIFCMLFPANINDCVIFKDTMIYYFQQAFPRPTVVLADTGAYSIENLRFLAIKKVIGIINAPKNVKHQNILQLSKTVRVNSDFLPPNWTKKECKKMYDVRTCIERQFSHNTIVYHAQRLNVRGIEQAAKHRYMILILDVLKALTCYKLGRGDLFQRSTAFSQARRGILPMIYRALLQREGYTFLKEEPHESARQKRRRYKSAKRD